jgi:adenine-specific DNA glycosylase
VIYDDSGRVLIAQRPLEGLLGGLWEFPAARCSGDDGESLVNCLKTALRQTLAVDAEIGTELIVVKHSFTHFKIRVHAFEGRLIPSMPKFIESNALPVAEGYADYRWALLAELDQYVFARTDRKVIDFLRGRDLRLF